MPNRKWTEAQQTAIEDEGGSLLVSAAAGSGKTAVLVERAVRLMTREDAPVPADRLLIVTFTAAAAEELRSRLGARIEQELRKTSGNVFFRRQRILLRRAAIGTMDAFCQQLVKEHFAQLDVPPDISVGDEALLASLSAVALDDTMEEMYEDEDLRYLSSYLIEKSFNFETLKLMCAIYHRNMESFNENQITSLVLDIFLLIILLPMIPARKRILEKIEHKNKEELLILQKKINHSLHFYNAIITDVMNKMKDLPNAKADEKDIEIYKNYFQFNKLSNEYSIRKDFTASDFAEILGRVERHNRSYNAND